MSRNWTRERSLRAHAAKARLRMQRAEADPVIDLRRVPVPRLPKPDFTIRIEDRFGERMKITVRRYYGKLMISTGQSAMQLCRGIEQLIVKSA